MRVALHVFPVGIACVALCALGLRWAWAPGTPPEIIACVASCGAICGLEPGRELDLVDVTCLRRALTGEAIACP
jgi:hypothetical protein